MKKMPRPYLPLDKWLKRGYMAVIMEGVQEPWQLIVGSPSIKLKRCKKPGLGLILELKSGTKGSRNKSLSTALLRINSGTGGIYLTELTASSPKPSPGSPSPPSVLSSTESGLESSRASLTCKYCFKSTT